MRLYQTQPERYSPFFCMIMHVTTYLKGLFRPPSFFMQFSKQVDVHWLTCEYYAVRMTADEWLPSLSLRLRTPSLFLTHPLNHASYLGLHVLIVLKHSINRLLNNVAHVVWHKGGLHPLTRDRSEPESCTCTCSCWLNIHPCSMLCIHSPPQPRLRQHQSLTHGVEFNASRRLVRNAHTLYHIS